MGRLRIFSFMSDAGQFGANQAYTAVVAGIVGFHTKGIKKKIFFYLVAVCGIIGLFLSGTRGAMAIPLAGLFLYFVEKKQNHSTFGHCLVGCCLCLFQIHHHRSKQL